MAEYHEIRVRPVVRYVVTEFKSDEDQRAQSSVALGEFDNVEHANRVATQLGWAIENTPRWDDAPHNPVVVETARALKIDWTRAPGAPQDAIEWHLHEVYPRVSPEQRVEPSSPPMTLERANQLLAFWGIDKRIVRPTAPRDEIRASCGDSVIFADPGEAGLRVALASVGIHGPGPVWYR